MFNIYATQNSWSESARALDDRRLDWQIYILYSAFMIKICRERDPGGLPPPLLPGEKLARIRNSPMFAHWCHNNNALTWSKGFLRDLYIEFNTRFGRIHPTKDNYEAFIAELEIPHEDGNILDQNRFIPKLRYANVINMNRNRLEQNLHEHYQYYLNSRWAIDHVNPMWTRREPPDWYNMEWDMKTPDEAGLREAAIRQGLVTQEQLNDRIPIQDEPDIPQPIWGPVRINFNDIVARAD